MINIKLKVVYILCAVFLGVLVFASFSSAEEITIAIQPAFPRKLTMEKMVPLKKYLEEDTGLKFKHIIPKDSKDLIAKIGAGRIKMAFICGGHIIRINRGYKDTISPLVIGVGMNGKTFHKGKIVVHVDSDIKDIQGIKGKKVEATAKYCVAGYVPQAAFCLDKGVNIPKDTELAFVPGYAKPLKIMSDLVFKKCDVGFLKEGMLKMMAERINTKQLKVLATSPYEIPNWTFIIHKDVDENITKRIKESLLKLNSDMPEHKKILTGLSVKGFTEVKMEDFDTIRSLFDKLEI